jgi:phosphosulfolactate synthase (CoM biosynthesis protein A)
MDVPFSFLNLNRRDPKPRTRGVTEIRGPYYSVVGPHYLSDVLETMGRFVDALKFAGGSFALMPRAALRQIIDLCHAHDVLVSTGGFIERVLPLGSRALDRYLDECRELGFDIVEISGGFVTLPEDDFVRLVEKGLTSGLQVKPEVGIQFGAGGASAAEALAAEGTGDVDRAVRLARRCLDAGAHMVMVESEGITESVRSWRTDAVSRFVSGLGIDHLMFEAADPAVFAWYVKHYGPEVNLFVDHSQIVQLECLRSGLWGDASLWGRVVTYR